MIGPHWYKVLFVIGATLVQGFICDRGHIGTKFLFVIGATLVLGFMCDRGHIGARFYL